ncbi:MAG: alpha-ketoglutarate-dependent dioxygenase AlkB [Gammaproteobacteria bacterium]|nr:alpha-ketoglutarate-dependent dioxygenase AlkB [Gammaproteobacteria bacterium]
MTAGDMFRPDWLGLVTDNRRLFDALEDGWLRPLPSQTGSIVGVDSYLREQGEVEGNRIPVRIRLDVAKLPDLKVAAFRHNQWETMPLSQVAPKEVAAVLWPGVLPFFSVSELTVPSEEHRIRLLGIGKRISNIEIPEVRVDCKDEEALVPSMPPPNAEATLTVPMAEDSIRGAISMALWAVPRIDPWMNVLMASLSFDSRALRRSTSQVNATWWRFPPWARPLDVEPDDVQERVWLAALEVLGSTDRLAPREVADRIAAEASKDGSAEDGSAVEEWRRETIGILRAAATIQHQNWQEHPVGLAIQLVLSRPEPSAFKTWFDEDQVNLAPAVAWSAATLCGLFHGYKQLSARFLGKQDQREVVAVQTLRMCSDCGSVDWPSISSDPPGWRREAGNFVITWGGREIVSKQERERGKWYRADLETEAVQREAVALAKTMDWRCLARVISLGQGDRPFSGSGHLEVRERTVKVRGDIEIQMSVGDEVEERIDRDAFLRFVTVAPGRLPAPPAMQSPIKSDRPECRIPGLKLVDGFLSEAEEKEILDQINRSTWSCELSRRVQHYGWRYDYTARQVDPSMHLGPLPEWADRIARRLFDEGYVAKLPDQVIVNEYKSNQGIAPHIDSKSSFEDGVAMISLLETWEMWFRKFRGDKVVVKLERCGAAIIRGEARYAWRHEIPKRKTEPGPVRRVPRHRRVSLTFRKVIGVSQPLQDGRLVEGQG